MEAKFEMKQRGIVANEYIDGTAALSMDSTVRVHADDMYRIDFRPESACAPHAASGAHARTARHAAPTFRDDMRAAARATGWDECIYELRHGSLQGDSLEGVSRPALALFGLAVFIAALIIVML